MEEQELRTKFSELDKKRAQGEISDLEYLEQCEPLHKELNKHVSKGFDDMWEAINKI